MNVNRKDVAKNKEGVEVAQSENAAMELSREDIRVKTIIVENPKTSMANPNSK